MTGTSLVPTEELVASEINAAFLYDALRTIDGVGKTGINREMAHECNLRIARALLTSDSYAPAEGHDEDDADFNIIADALLGPCPPGSPYDPAGNWDVYCWEQELDRETLAILGAIQRLKETGLLEEIRKSRAEHVANIKF